MTFTVDIAPGQSRATRLTVALGGVSVVLRLRWMPRLNSTGRWTLLVETPGGDALTPQLVVQGGAFVPLDPTHEQAPDGRLLWVGPETYRREDLGRSLRLVWAPTEAAA